MAFDLSALRARATRLRVDALALGLARRFVPAPVFTDCRERAEAIVSGSRVRRLTRRAAILLWIGVLVVSVVLAL